MATRAVRLASCDAVDMYGKLLDRNRKRVEDRLVAARAVEPEAAELQLPGPDVGAGAQAVEVDAVSQHPDIVAGGQ